MSAKYFSYLYSVAINNVDNWFNTNMLMISSLAPDVQCHVCTIVALYHRVIKIWGQYPEEKMKHAS